MYVGTAVTDFGPLAWLGGPFGPLVTVQVADFQ
jgi:hypothetical protein